MTIHLSLQSIALIIGGIAILVRPGDFQKIIAITLICVGVFGMVTL